jgi:hypothetical protein
LCGAVSYQVTAPLEPVLACHCEECRRSHGHASATTAAGKGDLVLVEARGLRWITGTSLRRATTTTFRTTGCLTISAAVQAS